MRHPQRVAVIASDAEVARLRRIASDLVEVIASGADEVPDDLPIVVIGEPASHARDPRVTHAVRAGVADDELRALLTAVATGRTVTAPPDRFPAESAAEARRAQRVFAASRRLASTTDLRATEAVAVEVIRELLGAERAYCLFFHAGDGSLWSEARLRADGDDRRAIGGLAGWAAYTGLAARVDRAGDDPRWLATIDDPEGDASSRILVQPVVGADRSVQAVLIAARAARGAPFDDGDRDALARFAALASPRLDQLASHVEAQRVLETEAAGGLFRREALIAAEGQRWGDVVRVSPPWVAWAYWLLVVLLAGSAAFVTFGKVATYSSGFAVVRSTARTAVTTHSAGNISAVDVQLGDRVERGAVIARLDDADQRAAVERIGREFDTQLRNHMLDPSDAAADSALRQLRLQLEQARAALDQRLVRAPAAGTIADLRVRPGQRIAPGEIAASIVDSSGGLEVVALLPGEDRPQLHTGMQLRLELGGYRYSYQLVPIESVSSEVIAASEARRVLGADVADGIMLGGSVVVVRGKLPREEFEVDGQVFRYHDGMLGRAEVQLRSERIVFAILPGLRRLE